MPPKPFNPPRPSTSISTTKKGRPKGSTNKPKPDRASSTSTHKPKSKSTNGVKKSGAGKDKEKERLSAASVRSLLPSLSPDTDEAMSDISHQEGREERGEESDDPFASPPTLTSTLKRKSDQREQRIEEEDAHIADLDERQERIGDELLGVVLSRFFKRDGDGRGMRMSRDAVKAVGKYMDTFVREGVARAAWKGEERDAGAGVLEVEDLERLAPQLLLDF